MTTEQFMLLYGILMFIIVFLSVKISTLMHYSGEIIGKNHKPGHIEYKMVIKYKINSKVKTKEIKVTKEVFEKYEEGDEITIALYDF